MIESKKPGAVFCAIVAAWLLAFCGANLQAAPTGKPIEPAIAQTDSGTVNSDEALRLIYALILPSNHNYDGHRGAALKEIREAAGLYGLKLTGAGGGKEPQEESDARLGRARLWLSAVRSQLTYEEERPVVEHLDRAINELTLALKAVAVDPPATVLPIPINPEEADALQAAYLVLSPGKRNYQGQRAEAMSKIQLAAGLAGIKVAGIARHEEPQSESDERLTLAWRYLAQVRLHLTAENQKPMLNFIDAAMQRLSLALECRASLARGR